MKRDHGSLLGMTKIELLIVLLILGALVVFITPIIQWAKFSGGQISCAFQMERLARAIHEYHDTNGALPPPWGPIVPEGEIEVEEVDESGGPVEIVEEGELDKWSWRVRILPYIENHKLYDQFHFDEPWDSGHNLRVAADMPGYFSCSRPGEPYFKEINGHKIPLTNYVMITGPDTVGPTDGTVRTLDDITDKKGETLMIVEVWGENRPAWTEPIDITLEDIARGVNAESGKSISGRHLSVNRFYFEDDYEGVNFCYADGSTSFHYSSPPGPEQLLRMAIINDGEPVEQD